LRRPGRLVSDCCAGPGKLTAALGIRPEDNGKPFDGGDLSLTFPPEPPSTVLVGPRIGITKATDKLWRFGLAGHSGLSRPFPPQGMSNPGGANSKPSN
jgi:DNA-3-methyladenine glycosylase